MRNRLLYPYKMNNNSKAQEERNKKAQLDCGFMK